MPHAPAPRFGSSTSLKESRGPTFEGRATSENHSVPLTWPVTIPLGEVTGGARAIKLVGYLRVSTEGQADDGQGLDVQRIGMERWAKRNSHTIAVWASDEGVSGSNGIESRRGLLDALTSLEDGRVEGLVVYRLDRLARSLTIQEGTLTKVWALGGTVFAVDLGEVCADDPDDPMRTALRQMVGVFAQLERGMISARMRSGRRLARERGFYAGDGAPPFGMTPFEATDEPGRKRLAPHASEQATAVRILALHAENKSLRQIVETLEAEGLRPKRGGRWHPTTVSRVIERQLGRRQLC
jgi:DNA invertase Pin-like site-specific DNA recombinase